MVVDYFFDLTRPHLVSSRIDDIFKAIDDKEIPFVVHVCDITGVEPVLFYRLRSLLRFFPISFHYLRSPNNDLPGPARRQIFPSAQIHNLRICIREGNADRSRLRFLNWIGVGKRACLRKAVSLHKHFMPNQLIKRGLHASWQRRRVGPASLKG